MALSSSRSVREFLFEPADMCFYPASYGFGGARSEAVFSALIIWMICLLRARMA